MIDVATIKIALERHVPNWEEVDETVQPYLEGILADEDAYDDLDALIEAVQPFLDDDRQVAENVVRAIAPKTTSATSGGAAIKAPTTSVPAKANQRVVQEVDSHEDDYDTASSSSSEQHNNNISSKKKKKDKEAANATKSHAAQRKERQRQKREQRKNKNNKSNKKQSPEPPPTPNNKKEEDLQNVVKQINTESAQELNEMDDYSSAWDAVKASGGVWGGRGYGGRGVNRGLGEYKGKDAVVNQLTLSYGGKELLLETHLAISQKHRYGLMGQNGCGKSTLLKRIASQSIPGWPLHLSVEMVEQEVLGKPKSVIETMQEISSQGGGANNNNNNNNEQKKQELQEEITELETVLEDSNADPEALESAAERLSELYDQLEALDNDEEEADNSGSDDEEKKGGGNSSSFASLDVQARKILKGLQFKESMLDTPGNLLSGGWRMRLALARALYLHPDILLLDEPTNHLDLSAILFLQDFLVSKEMTVVVVSHDGHFLDAICTDMIKFETNHKLKYHVGNYSSFKEMQEQAWARNCKKADATARKEKKAMEFIQKQRSMANSKHRDDNKQRQAAERQKKLGRIGLVAENGQKFKLLAEGNTKKGGSNRAGHIFGNYTTTRKGMTSAFVSNEKKSFGEDHQYLNFKFPAAPPLKGGAGGNLITMEDGRFRYPSSSSSDNSKQSAWLLQDMSLNVSYGSRVAIVGKNGAGKSTLLKLLCDELTLNSGEFHKHPNLKIAHIAQHHIEHLASYLQSTPVQYFMQTQQNAKNEQEVRQFLGGFGLVGALALQKIGTLSGGQKARLAFATVMYTEPHLLILDEPTNHLDGDSLESLAMAVEKFEGAVVIVSHNQDFMSRCANEMWTVANGRVKVDHADGEMTTFDDLFEQYKTSLIKELQQQKRRR